jgi:preprotein translocase subunit SecE
MSKDRVASSTMWLGELFHIGVYKRSQGRVTRQATFAALAAGVALGVWRFSVYFGPTFRGRLGDRLGPEVGQFLGYATALTLLLAGLWLCYRAVNVPRFADFLIAVEAEMNKVSWPSRAELYRASAVVIFVIFTLSLLLFGFDLVWGFVFERTGILKSSS